MKTWSAHWKASKNPKKQRKYVYQAPLHIKGKLLQAHLTKELAKKHNTRSLRIRKGDHVKIMRGNNKGKTGTVDRVDTKHTRIYVSTATYTKKDGTKTYIPLHPSKLLITELTNDRRRTGGKQ